MFFTEVIHQLERLRSQLGSPLVDALIEGFGICNQLGTHRGQILIEGDGRTAGAPTVPVTSQTDLYSVLQVTNLDGFIDDNDLVHNGAAVNIIGPVIIQAGNPVAVAEAGDFGGGGGGGGDTTQVTLKVTSSAQVNGTVYIGGDIVLDGGAADGGDIQFPADGGDIINNVNFVNNVVFQANIKDGDGNNIVILEDLAGHGNCKVLTIACDGAPTFIPKLWFNPGPYADGENLTDIIVFSDTAGANETGQVGTITLTDAGTVGRGTGKVHTDSAQFDGSADYFTTTRSTAIDETAGFTVTGWVKFDGTGAAEYILANEDDGTSYSELQIGKDSSELMFINVAHIGNANYTTAKVGSAVSAAKWNFFAARWNQNTQTCEMDVCPFDVDWGSRYSASASHADDITDSGGNLYIGAEHVDPSAVQNYLDGDMDALHFHGSYLSDGQLESLFNSGDGLSYT